MKHVTTFRRSCTFLVTEHHIHKSPMLPGQQSLVTFNRIYTFSLRHSVPHLPIYRTVVPVAALPLWRRSSADVAPRAPQRRAPDHRGCRGWMLEGKDLPFGGRKIQRLRLSPVFAHQRQTFEISKSTCHTSCYG